MIDHLNETEAATLSQSRTRSNIYTVIKNALSRSEIWVMILNHLACTIAYTASRPWCNLHWRDERFNNNIDGTQSGRNRAPGTRHITLRPDAAQTIDRILTFFRQINRNRSKYTFPGFRSSVDAVSAAPVSWERKNSRIRNYDCPHPVVEIWPVREKVMKIPNVIQLSAQEGMPNAGPSFS